MDKIEKENYNMAGEIAKDVREWSKRLIVEGMKIVEIANNIEKRIEELGGKIAFPVNICINDITAHYTPKFNDNTAISKNDIVSVDLGVHIDGYIADTAYTIDLSNKYKDLLNVNREALERVTEIIKPEMSVAEIGREVQKIINDAGYKPIENLTGHEIKRYDLHAGISIPSINVPYNWKIRKDMVLAIEPFATDGYGRVIESVHSEIFSFENYKPVRMREGRILLNEIEKRKKLPFAKRWYVNKINPLRLELVLRELLSVNAIKKYPVLHEKDGGMVSQFEHTLIITGNGCNVIT
ncbi:MAG: type II methionyl aminopeptidase [Candidatus Altiarchaeales archaeon]|nr:MAG: type II methionyl aminopeptidase [Candidatus Altiarchaeales archaeon]